VLERELGIEPEQETRELYQQIMRKPALKDPPTGPPAPPSARRRRSRHGRAPASPEITTAETPLVGREGEIGRLRQILGEAWTGRGQIVVMLGEVGVGKSRVVEEMMREAERRKGLTLLGRSYEAERVLPYRPWVDAFRSSLLISCADLLEELAPAWRAELARLFPELGELEPRWATGAEDYLRLFEAIAQLLAHLARRQPLLLALEDLHWADEMSVRLLSFLARRLSTLPVLILGTAWDAELDGAGFLRGLLHDLNQERLLTQLSLPPLSKAETLALVRARAKAGTEESMASRWGEAIWRASEGNPFMVVETMRALQEGDALRGATDEGGDRLPLPERVREVITRRLDRVDERGQQIIALGATIGGEFEFRLLQRASGLGDIEAARVVEELVRRRLLHGVGERFGFTHGTIREVAYGHLLAPRRKLLTGKSPRLSKSSMPTDCTRTTRPSPSTTVTPTARTRPSTITFWPERRRRNATPTRTPQPVTRRPWPSPEPSRLHLRLPAGRSTPRLGSPPSR
jgi:predicted ATPase